MAKDNSRISINKFESGLKDDNAIEVILGGTDDVVIQINKTLPLIDMMEFVSDVVLSCVDTESGEYTPEAYDFAIRVAVLTRYANFKMPTNYEKQYLLIYNTDAYEQVMQYINKHQFQEIIKAIDKKINYMLDVISSSAATKIIDIVEKLNEFIEVGEQSFSGIDPSEISSVIKKLSKFKTYDEGKLAEAVLKNSSKTVVEEDDIAEAIILDEK